MSEPLDLDAIKARADRCHHGISSNVTHYLDSQADVPALIAEVERARLAEQVTGAIRDKLVASLDNGEWHTETGWIDRRWLGYSGVEIIHTAGAPMGPTIVAAQRRIWRGPIEAVETEGTDKP